MGTRARISVPLESSASFPSWCPPSTSDSATIATIRRASCRVRRELPTRRKTASSKLTRACASDAATVWKPARTMPGTSIPGRIRLISATSVRRGWSAANSRPASIHARLTPSTSETSKTRRASCSAPCTRSTPVVWRTRNAAVGPNVYYLGKPEHLDLVSATFGPRAPRLLRPAEVWRRMLKPLVLAAVGVTFLGQAVAFFYQLRTGEKDFEE